MVRWLAQPNTPHEQQQTLNDPSQPTLLCRAGSARLRRKKGRRKEAKVERTRQLVRCIALHRAMTPLHTQNTQRHGTCTATFSHTLPLRRRTFTQHPPRLQTTSRYRVTQTRNVQKPPPAAYTTPPLTALTHSTQPAHCTATRTLDSTANHSPPLHTPPAYPHHLTHTHSIVPASSRRLTDCLPVPPVPPRSLLTAAVPLCRIQLAAQCTALRSHPSSA